MAFDTFIVNGASHAVSASSPLTLLPPLPLLLPLSNGGQGGHGGCGIFVWHCPGAGSELQ